MAQTLFSLLLLKRLCLSSKNPKPHFTSCYHILPKHPFSTSPLPTPNSNSTPLDSQTKPSSLSARMSFIFDQIDQMEKQKQDNDQTLQRIRAWRQSREQQQQTQEKFSETRENQKIDDNRIQKEPVTVFKTQQNPEVGTSVEDNQEMVSATKPESLRKGVELVHPWVEWIELMERLVKQNYFDHRRKDEDKMVNELGLGEIVENDDVGIDFNDLKTVQTACVNFGKDRFDILRSLSRQDIQILVGYGCANTDKKVVFSSKLLRKHVHLDEGEVCSSCSLRSSCERAYLLTNKEDEARTVDIMRVLLAYGFDHVNGTVTNKSLLKQKSVKNVVRKLLHEVVKLSSVPIDPNLPPPVIKRPPPKVKQPPPLPKKRVGRDDVEMKKGDWLCPKCDFMNFAKNTVCLQCDAKRPKRQLLPGEWECPECNFLNYRRNMSCFHCDCKRPPDEFMENKTQETQRNPRKEPEKIARSDVSNAWNFDFDDDESDGADVAAFEYADSTARHKDSHLISQPHGGNLVDLEENFDKTRKNPRAQGVGFDDFDDEDDDVDSYEIDTQNDSNLVVKNASLNDFSDVEDIEGYNNNFRAHSRSGRPTRQKSTFSGSEDGDESDINTDDDISTHPNWKASHVANSIRRSNNRGQTGYSRGLSFGSDDEFALDDDSDDDLRSGQTRGRKTGFGRNSRSRVHSGSEDDSFSGYESNRSRCGGNNFEGGRRGSGSNGRGGYEFVRDREFGSRGKMSTRGNSRNGGGLKRSSRGSLDKWETTNRGGDSRNFKGPKRGGGSGFGNSPRGRSYKYGEDNVSDSSEFRNSRRVIER